jgi:predicted RND superfamily exporter protein
MNVLQGIAPTALILLLFLHDLRSLLVVVISMPLTIVIGMFAIKAMGHSLNTSTLIAIVLIIIVLWQSLRGWVRTLLAASPLVLGYIWMLGGMRLLSIDFNFLSIIISPLLIGIGVDNGIHVLHRTIEERSLNPDGAIERGTEATAVAVIVTSLTTMLVFGSLLAARTPGLRMLGTSALLGIGFSLLFSLLFLPAALRVEGGRRV